MKVYHFAHRSQSTSLICSLQKICKTYLCSHHVEAVTLVYQREIFEGKKNIKESTLSMHCSKNTYPRKMTFKKRLMYLHHCKELNPCSPYSEAEISNAVHNNVHITICTYVVLLFTLPYLRIVHTLYNYFSSYLKIE